MSCTNDIAWRKTSNWKSKREKIRRSKYRKNPAWRWNFSVFASSDSCSFSFSNACSSSGYVIRAWHLLMLRSKCHAWIGQPDVAQGKVLELEREQEKEHWEKFQLLNLL